MIYFLKKFLFLFFLVALFFVVKGNEINKNKIKYFLELFEIDIKNNLQVKSYELDTSTIRWGNLVFYYINDNDYKFSFSKKNKKLISFDNYKIEKNLNFETIQSLSADEIKKKSEKIIKGILFENFNEMQLYFFEKNLEKKIFGLTYRRKFNDFYTQELFNISFTFDGRIVSLMDTTTKEKGKKEIKISREEAENIAEDLVSKIVNRWTLKIKRFFKNQETVYKIKKMNREKIYLKYKEEISQYLSSEEYKEFRLDFQKPVYIHPNYFFQNKGYAKNNSILKKRINSKNTDLITMGEHFLRLAHVFYFDLNGYKISGLPYISVAVDTETGEIIGSID